MRHSSSNTLFSQTKTNYPKFANRSDFPLHKLRVHLLGVKMTTPNCSHYTRIDTVNLHATLTPRHPRLCDAIKVFILLFHGKCSGANKNNNDASKEAARKRHLSKSLFYERPFRENASNMTQ